MTAKEKRRKPKLDLTRAEICAKASEASAAARRLPMLTPEQLATITAMATVGVLRCQIAMYLRVGEEWLRVNYGNELDVAEVTAVAKVAQTLYTRATVGKDLGAAIFYLKARGGWREVAKDPVTPTPNSESSNGEARVSVNRLSAMIDRLADPAPGTRGTVSASNHSAIDSATPTATDEAVRPAH